LYGIPRNLTICDSTLAELEKPTMAELQEEFNFQSSEDTDGTKEVHDEQIPPRDALGSSPEKSTS
jgi:hypothetical protein